jgi:photosystem II stability/assembly factor-like uncharacterized protein
MISTEDNNIVLELLILRSNFSEDMKCYQKLLLLVISLAMLHTLSFAQQASKRIDSYKQHLADTAHPLNSIAFRNIGPSIMSGRVTDIEVNTANPNEFYVAYASGGVWHTINNGVSFVPIFDREASITIGDMLMDWQTHTLYVGTGECNSSRSSYAGTGVYCTKDSGKHWQLLNGTQELQHISKLILVDKGELLIASIGTLFSDDNSTAGLFYFDGNVAKKINVPQCSSGFIDLRQDQNNAAIIYACAWQRSRKPWQFNGEGAGSAIYKSTNGGKNWQCISCGTEGFPHNDKVGRIGIAIAHNDSKTVYALVDNQNRQAELKKSDKLTALQLKDMSADTFARLDDKKLDKYFRSNDYPSEYTAKSVKLAVKSKKYTVAQVADWLLSDRNYSLFATPVIGAELYKSSDAGATWKKTHQKDLEGLFWTYGYYFGTIEVDKANDSSVYLAGFTLLHSLNGGGTFKSMMQENCHPDYHEIWINPNNPAHLIAGNDGGINISYDTGNTWVRCNSPAVGQFYTVQVDNAEPYNVYGGLQDNGTWVGKSTHTENKEWHTSGKYGYTELGGGDGMQVQVDTRTNNTVYTGAQFGFYQRSDRNGKTELSIHPTHKIGEEPLRYNWQTPILLSKHQQDILYMGSNKLMRSLNKGADMEPISEDLTSTKKAGNVPYGTITTISESPIRFGILYCGTDDGNIWHSADGGYTFNKINTSAQGKWVSRVVASKYNKDRVYATHTGHTQDDFAPYIFVSNNAGTTWENIAGNLPHEPINVVREDLRDSNIIYVGTDNGLYVSVDRGKNYIQWCAALPRVAIHDIAIQDRENEIILGTHGRSIFIASLKNVQMLDSMHKIGFVVNAIDSVAHSATWGEYKTAYSDVDEANISIAWFSTIADSVEITVSARNKTLFVTKQACKAGYNEYIYHARTAPLANKAGSRYLAKGNYTVRIKQGTKQQEKALRIY